MQAVAAQVDFVNLPRGHVQFFAQTHPHPVGPAPSGVGDGLQCSCGGGRGLVHFDPRKPKLTSTELQDVAKMKATCDYDTAYHNCFLACMVFAK